MVFMGNHRKTIGNGGLMGFNGDQYPLVMTNITMENGHLWWITQLTSGDFL